MKCVPLYPPSQIPLFKGDLALPRNQIKIVIKEKP